jgi:hypothetical protein
VHDGVLEYIQKWKNRKDISRNSRNIIDIYRNKNIVRIFYGRHYRIIANNYITVVSLHFIIPATAAL